MLAHTPVDFNYLETLAKTFIIPARQIQSIQENIVNNAPIRRIAIAMNTNSAFTGSSENPFWYQQFHLGQIKKLRGSQPIVDSDAAAFHLSKFRHEEITGVHDVNVLSFISNYMYFLNFSNVNEQVF